MPSYEVVTALTNDLAQEAVKTYYGYKRQAFLESRVMLPAYWGALAFVILLAIGNWLATGSTLLLWIFIPIVGLVMLTIGLVFIALRRGRVRAGRLLAALTSKGGPSGVAYPVRIDDVGMTVGPTSIPWSGLGRIIEGSQFWVVTAKIQRREEFVILPRGDFRPEVLEYIRKRVVMDGFGD